MVAQAPAIQLSEHAQAILLDDQELGFEREDPVLQRLAKGSKHAATWQCHMHDKLMFLISCPPRKTKFILLETILV